MTYRYPCELCDKEFSGDDADQVATQAADHVREEHNEPLSREHIRSALAGEDVFETRPPE